MLNQKFKDCLRLVIYQVYPRSFMDTNGDGIGDLPGVTSKLDYLKELGVNAIWLCPCYKSPNDDNGYDISDYRDIMDEFGTMEDMKRLIAEMHARDMKVIMDLVPNHTSTAHRWFQESRKGRDNPYSDFYYWFDEIPNDWESCFRGSAWAFDEMRGQYYLHSYAVSQADLNWNNPAVVKAMQDVVDFWVDMGVDGFRVDVIDQISKDFEAGRNCFGPRLHEFIHALFGREKTAKLFTVGECWVDDIEEMRRHCAAERGELCTLFQFDHLDCGRDGKFTPKPDSLRTVRDVLVSWQEKTAQYDLLHSLFSDNHDNSMLISRAADDRAKRYESATCLAAMFYLLRACPSSTRGRSSDRPPPTTTASTASTISRASTPTGSSARPCPRRRPLPRSTSAAVTTPGIPWRGAAAQAADSLRRSPGFPCTAGIRKSTWRRIWPRSSRCSGSIRRCSGCGRTPRPSWTARLRACPPRRTSISSIPAPWMGTSGWWCATSRLSSAFSCPSPVRRLP